MKVDLHMHSQHSIDGIEKVASILNMVEASDLDIFAITDHDNMAANYEALKLIKRRKNFKPRFIAGVELSAVLDEMWVHILGLNFNLKDAHIKKAMRLLKDYNSIRMQLIAKRVMQLGYKIDKYMLKQLVKDRRPFGKGELAEVMVRSGALTSINAAYKILDPIRFPGYQLIPKGAIEIIREAGGLACLAHPIDLLKQCKDKAEFEKILGEFCKCGLNGIEVFCPRHKKEDEEYFEDVAKRFKLLVSGGSDFHGLGRRTAPGEAIGSFTNKFDRLTIIDSLQQRKKSV